MVSNRLTLNADKIHLLVMSTEAMKKSGQVNSVQTRLRSAKLNSDGLGVFAELSYDWLNCVAVNFFSFVD